jgi:hypothetical protein
MHLHNLLQRISNNQDVNFDQVIKHLPSGVAWGDIFRVSQAGKNKHDVEIINFTTFNTLLAQSAPVINRAQAASSSLLSSHDIKSDSAYMLCFPRNNTLSNTRKLEVAALSQNTLLPLPFKPAKQAILIENQDCFFQWERFVKHFNEVVSVNESDIYFTGGSRVLNDSLSPILNQYAQIKCLFDYDLAGLQMALLLAKKGYNNVEYSLPNNIEKHVSLFTFSPANTADFLAMLALCEQHKFEALAGVLRKSKGFMEQEALLGI